MRGIIVIFTVFVVVKCRQVPFNENDLQQLQKALHESAIYMRNEVKHEDVSICIGATRAGKSTLINYLIGNKLKSVRHSRISPISIEKVDNQSLGPEIGRGATSKTTIPTKWVSNIYSNIIIWDAPGFDDNRGAVQDITNAFYLYQLVQNVKSLKIILAIDVNDLLHDNIKPFISVLKAVESLLGEKMIDFYSSISVIFTKVPNTLEGIPVNMDFINEKLEEQFLTSITMELSYISKEFVHYLIKHNQQIGFFKRPETEDNITSAVDVNIFQAINNSLSIPKNNLQQLRPSISESSSLCLYSIRDKLYSKSAFEELQTALDLLIDKKAMNADNLKYDDNAKYQLQLLQKELSKIENALFETTVFEHDFFKQIEILKMIDVDIGKIINENHLLETVNLIEFVDKLLNLEESKILSKKLQKVLSTSLLKTKAAISSIREYLGEITRNEMEESMRRDREMYMQQLLELNHQIEVLNKENESKKSFWNTALKLAPVFLSIAHLVG